MGGKLESSQSHEQPGVHRWWFRRVGHTKEHMEHDLSPNPIFHTTQHPSINVQLFEVLSFLEWGSGCGAHASTS